MSDNDKEKAREIFCSPNAIDFMSSEESDNDDPASSRGPKPRKVRKLVWEKSKLKNLKAKLDEAYLEGLSEKQRRASARLTRTEEPSVRPCPTNGPRWAIRTENWTERFLRLDIILENTIKTFIVLGKLYACFHL